MSCSLGSKEGVGCANGLGLLLGVSLVFSITIVFEIEQNVKKYKPVFKVYSDYD
jgi:hypothetical protein